MKYNCDTITIEQYRKLKQYDWDNLYYCSTSEEWQRMMQRFERGEENVTPNDTINVSST